MDARPKACTFCSTARARMETVKGQVNEGDTILIDHSDGRTFFVKVEAGK